MKEQFLISKSQVDNNSPKKLFSDGVGVAASAFGLPITPEFELDVYNHLLNHNVIFAHNEKGEALGFTSYEYLPCEIEIIYPDGFDEVFGEKHLGILYISGTVVKKDRQQNGVGSTLTRQAFHEVRKLGPVDYIVGRTQNPVVARSRRNRTLSKIEHFHPGHVGRRADRHRELFPAGRFFG